jgi:hypothetical protein
MGSTSNLAILRGAPLAPTRHRTLANMLLGAALGALVIDARLSDEEVMSICEDVSRYVFDADDLPDCDATRHRRLATRVLRMAIDELHALDRDIMAVCGSLLAQIRAAWADAIKGGAS